MPMPLSARGLEGEKCGRDRQVTGKLSRVAKLRIGTRYVGHMVSGPDRAALARTRHHAGIRGVFGMARPGTLSGGRVLLVSSIAAANTALLSYTRAVTGRIPIHVDVVALK